MMRYRHFIACLMLLLVGAAASAQVDSLSYAVGYMTSIEVIKNENNDLPGLVDVNPDEYLRGLKEGLFRYDSPADSASRNSYYSGFISGNYWSYFQSEITSYNCMKAGASRVVEGNVTLPQDTIRALEVITGYEAKDSLEHPSCEFFEALGLLLPYKDEVRAMLSPDGAEALYSPKDYARGFVDAMEINALRLTGGCNDSYKWGKWIGSSVTMYDNKMPEGFNPNDFMRGSEAAFSKSPELIDSLTCFTILGLYRDYEADVDTVVVEEVEPYYPDSADDDDSVFSSVSVKYKVDWKIEVFPIADANTAGEEAVAAFEQSLRKLNARYDYGPGLKAYADGRSRYVSFGDEKLPKGYKWFSTMDDEGRLFYGIVTTKDCFKAKVKEIDLVTFMGSNEHEEAQFKFNGKDAKRWADFTRKNIGTTVVMMVNGRYAMSPAINSEIEGGACTISGSIDSVKRFIR